MKEKISWILSYLAASLLLFGLFSLPLLVGLYDWHTALLLTIVSVLADMTGRSVKRRLEQRKK